LKKTEIVRQRKSRKEQNDLPNTTQKT